MNKNKNHEVVDASKVERCKQVILENYKDICHDGVYYMRKPHHPKEMMWYMIRVFDAEGLTIDIDKYEMTAGICGLNNLEYKALKRWYDAFEEEECRKFAKETHRRLQEYYAALEEERKKEA